MQPSASSGDGADTKLDYRLVAAFSVGGAPLALTTIVLVLAQA
jgi:hypothetical protein